VAVAANPFLVGVYDYVVAKTTPFKCGAQVFGPAELETGRVHAKHLPGRSSINRWQVGNDDTVVDADAAHVTTDESRHCGPGSASVSRG